MELPTGDTWLAVHPMAFRPTLGSSPDSGGPEIPIVSAWRAKANFDAVAERMQQSTSICAKGMLSRYSALLPLIRRICGPRGAKLILGRENLAGIAPQVIMKNHGVASPCALALRSHFVRTYSATVRGRGRAWTWHRFPPRHPGLVLLSLASAALARGQASLLPKEPAPLPAPELFSLMGLPRNAC